MATTIKHLEVKDANLFTSLLTLTAYLFAGKAQISIHNTLTGRRFSYKLTVARIKTERGGTRPAHGQGPWDIEVRTGKGWEPIGYVFKGKSGLRFINGTRRRWDGAVLGRDSFQVRAFCWLVERIRAGKELPSPVQVWRDDNCGRCGAELISEYRHIGFGPICCGHLGIDDKLIFRSLASLATGNESTRIERVREMVYRALSHEESTVLRLLPGLPGDYARQHLQAAA